MTGQHTTRQTRQAQQPRLPRMAPRMARPVCVQCPPPAKGRQPRPVHRYGRDLLCASHAPNMCIDCFPDGLPEVVRRAEVRPAPHPGPRCTTHHRAARRRANAAAHDRYVVTTYDLAPGEYAALIAFQGGRCPICQRATGRTKRLAVDHDHATGIPRGAPCGPCNQMLGHARDDPAMFARAIDYLRDPPVARMRRQRERGQ